MSFDVKRIRDFLLRKLTAAQKAIRRSGGGPDPYRKGYIDALAMVQSFIDKNVAVKEEDFNV